MRIFIAGIDGYLGWPLAMHLALHGHEVHGIDNMSRRSLVKEVGSHSAIPIKELHSRVAIFKRETGMEIHAGYGDLRSHDSLLYYFKSFPPDAIVHLGEMPSAPYSMIDEKRCRETHDNNVGGTLSILWAIREVCPDAHLLKLGTMGEYGVPGVSIPEGDFEMQHRGRTARMQFPRQPGSFYHCTKVHDTCNVEFCCRIWGLRATDIMQGVVYGTRISTSYQDHAELATRFDFDSIFGTVINRFCAQAVAGVPITPYGKGGQHRGFLPLKDSIQCLTLALVNPPEPGQYRVFNQMEDTYNILDLAEMVKEAGETLGLRPTIQLVENPRIEAEDHYYDVDHQKLLDLGYVPTSDMRREISEMLTDLLPWKERILKMSRSIAPVVTWSGR